MNMWCSSEQLLAIQYEHDRMRAALREFHEENRTDDPVKYKDLQAAVDAAITAAKAGSEIELQLEACTGTAVIPSLLEEHPPEKRLAPEGVHFAPAQRVSGELRDRYLNHLREMYAQEYVDLDEMDARQDAMTKAKTEGELKLLLCDLPPLPPVVTEKKEVTARKMSASMAYAMSAIVMFVIFMLGSFVAHSAAGMAVFILGFTWTVAFGVLSCVSRK